MADQGTSTMGRPSLFRGRLWMIAVLAIAFRTQAGVVPGNPPRLVSPGGARVEALLGKADPLADGPGGRALMPFGVCLHADGRAETTAASFDQIAGMGVGVVRTDFTWGQFQPDGPGLWNDVAVKYFDEFVTDARQRDLEVVAILSQPPQWAVALYKEKGVEPFLDAFGQYAAEVARLYGDRVSYYQYWNEPNNFFTDFLSKHDRWRVYLAGDRAVRAHVANPVGMVNYDADVIYRPGWKHDLRAEFTELARADPHHTIRTIAVDVYPSTWSPPASLWGWQPLRDLNSILTDSKHPCFGFNAAVTETGYSHYLSEDSLLQRVLGRGQDGQARWFQHALPTLVSITSQLAHAPGPSRYLFVALYELYDTQSPKFFDPEARFGIFKSDRIAQEGGCGHNGVPCGQEDEGLSSIGEVERRY